MRSMKVQLAVALVMATMLMIGGSALRAQMQPEEDIPLDDANREAIVDTISAALVEGYIFLDVAKEMEKHIRNKLKKGQYDDLATVSEFAGVLTEDLREISHDLHLAVNYASPEMMARQSANQDHPEMDQQRMEEIARRNYEFKKIEILPGNVGYLRFDQFLGANYAGPTAIAAMNFLANTDALIIDLRRNGGGDPSLIQLITSYFFDERVHLNSFYIRKDDKTDQFWTATHVEGPKMTATDLYVLTSRFTFSGAEEFSYNLKNLERATIVGETTGGGAHPVDFFLYPSINIQLKLPFGRAINPITGTNWEGVGVTPDVAVDEAVALETAHTMALRKIRDEETDERRQYALDWAIDGVEAKANPVAVTPEILASYAGIYGPRTLTFENGVLYYQRQGRQRAEAIPMTEKLFRFEGIDQFRLEVVTDQSGQPVKIVGHYDNGHSDESPRTSEN
jgi:hypothetical protein